MTRRKRQNANPEAARPGDTVLDLLGDERFQAERKLAAKYRELPEGFMRWCEAETYVLDKKTNAWVPFRFEPWQADEVRRVLRPDPLGNLQFTTLVFSWPRRHGKSELSARYDIWRCRNYEFQNVVIGSNSEAQTLSTAFTISCDTIRNSPKLKALLDRREIRILANTIEFTRTHSSITGIPTSEASAYGQKINVGHITELCKARDDSLYQVVASSTGDAHLGVTIADSNVGSVDNKVWQLMGLARSGADPTIGVSYISYRDLEDAVARRPRWIEEGWLRSRAAQMTPGEFRRNHLNIPAAVGEKLFTEAQVNRCFTAVPKGWDGAALPGVFSAQEFKTLRDRCALYGVLMKAGGLDRALPFARQDRTFWALVAKMLVEPEAEEVPVYDADGNLLRYETSDPFVYILLNLVELRWSNAAAIQREIESDMERYDGIDGASIEQYQAADIHEWALTKGIPAVLTHFTGPVQLEAYSEYYRIVVSGRFFASPAHWILREEMRNLEEDSSGRIPAFGGPHVTINDPQGKPVRIKDDSVEAVVNAVIGARGEFRVPQGPPRSVRRTSVFAETY